MVLLYNLLQQIKGELRSHFSYKFKDLITIIILMAGVTGLEPATYRVTGDRSNQLSYTPHILVGGKGLEPLTPSV